MQIQHVTDLRDRLALWAGRWSCRAGGAAVRHAQTQEDAWWSRSRAGVIIHTCRASANAEPRHAPASARLDSFMTGFECLLTICPPQSMTG